MTKKTRRYHLIEPVYPENRGCIEANRAFRQRFQAGLLLALLERRQITQSEFERCMEAVGASLPDHREPG